MRKTLIAAALTATAIVALPGSAEAQSATVKDATGDVYTYASDGDGTTKIGTAPNVDLRRSTIAVSHKRITVTSTFVDLTRASETLSFWFEVRTDKGLTRDATLSAEPKMRAGRVDFSTANNKSVTCKGITHRVSYAENTFTVSIPATCLNSPRWIKAQIGAASIGHVSDPTSTTVGTVASTVLIDNGMGDKIPDNADWSAKIYR
jgi:hypothetical protein